MTGIDILATGSFLPPLTVTNDDLARCVDTNDEWIRTRTGISTRHMNNGEPTWYMGACAAKQAIERAGIDPSEIGVIICSTVTGDYHSPTISAVIQRETGALGCPAFDVAAACSGFVYALDIAQKFLSAGTKYALVVSSERLSAITDFTDRASCILFGDGAAAVLLRASDSLFSSWLSCDGSGMRYLYAKMRPAPHPFMKDPVHIDDESDPDAPYSVLVQDGREVYRFATKALPRAVENALEGTGLTPADIDLFIPHQANIRIIETAAKSMGIPLERFYTNIDHCGNTSSASIPIALDEAVTRGVLKRGMTVCFVGFGAGLTSAAAILKY